MRRSAADETHAQGSSRAPRHAPAPQSTAASSLLALHGSAGNAAVTAVIQRMEAAGGKRQRSGSPEEQGPAKHVREAESSSSEEDSEPLSGDAVAKMDRQQTAWVKMLEDMDSDGYEGPRRDILENGLAIISLVRNLLPLRSVSTVNEALRLVNERPDSPIRKTYLRLLEDQLDYLEDDFPSDGPPTEQAVRGMWTELVPAFGAAGAQVGEDGCEDRAHAICRVIAAHHPAIAAHHLAKQWATSSGSRLHADHQWNHHVAASVTTASGVLVIDPVFSRAGPIPLAQWIAHVQVDPAHVHEVAWGFLGRPGADHRPDAHSAVEYLPS
ncbi:protein-glutamine glutaminase family protein [Streptacidiphilus fuscans]|uniref:Protein glutaminase domain-containing protein n=1 Tax=Streptacidiphilus fuscans TaxID=2789292 RepID=A0A931FEH2_9ACTN|nr:protein-glutamine glutaminase family protein [Streptacidiphilus fuscans]MBF9069215.1 hypothetical protein [Streptacidiphilus fuscans]